MSEKITIPAAIVIVFLIWYFFLGGNVFIKTSIDYTNTLAPVEKIIESQGIIPPADTQPEGEIETPLVLYVVSEGMDNGISIENDGTVIFTLNIVELESIRRPSIDIPLKQDVLKYIKIDSEISKYLYIEYLYAAKGGENYLRFTTDIPTYFRYNKVELTYASNQKETVEIYFPPPG